MQVIIMGAGKIGSNICETLGTENYDICVIDHDEEALEKITQNYDVLGVLGNGSSFEVQKEANRGEDHVFIAVTANDEMNLLACIIAQELGAFFTIARVRGQEYAFHLEDLKQMLKVSMLLNPERLVAEEISRLVHFPTALSVEPFANRRVNMVQIEVPEEHLLVGENLIRYRQECPETLICTIIREEEVIIPTGTTRIQSGDRLFIIGTLNKLDRVYTLFSSTHDTLKSLLIVGGGRITYYLLHFLGNMRRQLDIKVIEADEKICEMLSQEFPSIDVIWGDGTDQDILEEEGIRHYDSVISLTGVDEENILISMFSHTMGVPRNITKVNRLRLLDVIGESTLQTIVTPHESAANDIIHVIRSLTQNRGSNLEAVYRIGRGEVEAIQFQMTGNAGVCNIELKDLLLQEDTLIALIIRGQEIIIPGGFDRILPGDRIIVVNKGLHIVNATDIKAD